MITFYHHPLSPISRRVWWALLEKQIPFQPVEVNLRGDQHQPEFLALNPFHHVPVLVDNQLRLVESLAILDYLERQYPQPGLLPTDADAYGRVKMVEMVITNELMTKILSVVGGLDDPAAFPPAAAAVAVVLTFLNDTLGHESYFGGHTLSLADIVAGTAIPLFVRLEIPLAPYPALAAWYDRITGRPAWQQTNPSDAAFGLWRRFVAAQIKAQNR